MSKSTPVITDFSRGELGRKMDGRIDLPDYYQGASVLENVIVLPQGGATRRPGLRFFTEAENADKFSRLIPFVINESTRYVLEFHDGGIRVIKNDPNSTPKRRQIMQYTLTLDTAPAPADFPIGAKLTGQSSGATCFVVGKTSSTVYTVTEVSGTFDDGEAIADNATTPNSGDQGAGFPTVSGEEPFQVITTDGSTFYSEQELRLLQFRTKITNMFITRDKHPPKVLSWYSDGYWVLTTLQMDVKEWEQYG